MDNTSESISIILWRAAQNGNFDLVKECINTGKENLNKNNALYWALAYSHVEIAKFLIEKGARECNAGFISLAENGKFEIIEEMITFCQGKSIKLDIDIELINRYTLLANHPKIDYSSEKSKTETKNFSKMIAVLQKNGDTKTCAEFLIKKGYIVTWEDSDKIGFLIPRKSNENENFKKITKNPWQEVPIKFIGPDLQFVPC